jgi:hypothetical protein
MEVKGQYSQRSLDDIDTRSTQWVETGFEKSLVGFVFILDKYRGISILSSKSLPQPNLVPRVA